MVDKNTVYNVLHRTTVLVLITGSLYSLVDVAFMFRTVRRQRLAREAALKDFDSASQWPFGILVSFFFGRGVRGMGMGLGAWIKGPVWWLARRAWGHVLCYAVLSFLSTSYRISLLYLWNRVLYSITWNWLKFTNLCLITNLSLPNRSRLKKLSHHHNELIMTIYILCGTVCTLVIFLEYTLCWTSPNVYSVLSVVHKPLLNRRKNSCRIWETPTHPLPDVHTVQRHEFQIYTDASKSRKKTITI